MSESSIMFNFAKNNIMKKYTIVFNLFLGLSITVISACSSSKNTSTSTTSSNDIKEVPIQQQPQKGVAKGQDMPIPQLQANDVAKEPTLIMDDEIVNELPAIQEPKISPEQEAAMKAKLQKEMEKLKKKG